MNLEKFEGELDAKNSTSKSEVIVKADFNAKSVGKIDSIKRELTNIDKKIDLFQDNFVEVIEKTRATFEKEISNSDEATRSLKEGKLKSKEQVKENEKKIKEAEKNIDKQNEQN